MSTFKKYSQKNIKEGAIGKAIKGGLKGAGFGYASMGVGALAGGVIGSVGGPMGALAGIDIGGALGVALAGTIFGGMIQKRLNSFYYECKSKSGDERKTCQIELLQFVMQKLRSHTPRDVKEKARITKALNTYNTRLRKLQGKLHESFTDVAEAQRFGKLKGFLTGPIMTGAITNVRKDDLAYHCNEIEDKADRAECRAALAKKIKEIQLSRSKKKDS